MYISIDATDIAAYLVIIGCFILMALGVDSELKSIIALAAGWAFRKPITNTSKKLPLINKKES